MIECARRTAPRLAGTAARALIERSSVVRAVVHSAVVQKVIATVRRQVAVHDRGRFVVAELILPPGVRTFALRGGGGLSVVLRSRSRDVEIFDELFVGVSAYEPPAVLRQRLEAPDGPLTVVDLGGNIGLFGVMAFRRWPVATLTSLEPDGHNAELLARCISINGLDDRWTLTTAAAGDHVGHAEFESGNFADSRLVSSAGGGTVTVPMLDVFDVVRDVDLLKMDIEGGEWPILLDGRLSDLDAQMLVLEWHVHGAPHGDPRDAATEALERAGFCVLADPPGPYDHGTIWAYRNA